MKQIMGETSLAAEMKRIVSSNNPIDIATLGLHLGISTCH
jgi:hypothetical protein